MNVHRCVDRTTVLRCAAALRLCVCVIVLSIIVVPPLYLGGFFLSQRCAFDDSRWRVVVNAW
jgi:hypothetical protein